MEISDSFVHLVWHSFVSCIAGHRHGGKIRADVARYHDLSDIALVSLKHLDKHLLKLISRLESKNERREEFDGDVSISIKNMMNEIREPRNSGIEIGF